jgi:hypothetical protein
MSTLANAAIAGVLGPVLGDNLAAELRRAIPQCVHGDLVEILRPLEGIYTDED